MRRALPGPPGLVFLAFFLLAGCNQAPTPEPPAPPSSAALHPAAAPSRGVLQPPGRRAAPPSDAAPTGDAAPTEADADLAAEDDLEPLTLEEQRARLLATMTRELRLSGGQQQVIREVFALSPHLSQGNPELSFHPMTRAECRRVRAEAGPEAPESPRCGAPHMAPLYDPGAGQTEQDARVCVDRFEFPGIPCEYPVVYARASEAATLCRAVGKRLCDAHEWEGACAGALRPPEVEYAFDRDRLQATHQHNTTREITWAYGAPRDPFRCATFGWRSPKCTGEWSKCGSYTYPAGSFPSCRSPFGVYDLHGNVAEHMNLPLAPEEAAALGEGGVTEMKGSWFGFSAKLPHEDDCRWRAPSWHETRTMSPVSHRNYHLGFRCCKDAD
jgi:formylglycine-generating enzyme required for sulfatase activity